MKLLIRTDVHLCQYGSNMRTRGETFSTRLEGVIKSVSWSEKMARDHNCDYIIDMGDFFDRATLNAEELSSLDSIQWDDTIPHLFLIGNHEYGTGTGEYNSTELFNLVPNIRVIKKIEKMMINDTEIAFVPYMTESNRKPLSELLGSPTKRRVVFSHNDIKGIQMGPVVSAVGFDIDDIETHCDLFFNGHLHNGAQITKKIINLGNLTGHDFGENALKYAHNIAILDTDTLTFEYYENPYAFNYYKLGQLSKYNNLEFKSNSVVSCTCYDDQVDAVRAKLDANPNVIIHVETVERRQMSISVADQKALGNKLKVADHEALFYDYIVNKYGTDEIVIAELTEVLK